MKGKILFIEHEKRAIFYLNALKRYFHVDHMKNYNKEELHNRVEREIYDIIITDVMILPVGQEHDLHKPGEYKLPEIIKTIRDLDVMVKIIVFTDYDTRLNIDKDLVKVDYVLSKQVTGLDMFIWQVKRIYESTLSNGYVQHALNKELLEYLNQNTMIMWREELIEMLNDYRNGINEFDQFDEMLRSFNKIFGKIANSGVYTQFFKDLREFELLNIATSPYKFGHLRHVINVFWMGYYVINKILLTSEDFINHCPLKLNREEFNEMWLTVSLFHDYGHLGEKVPELVDSINRLTNKYPRTDCSVLGFNVKYGFETKKQKMFEKIFCKNELEYEMVENYNDHGIISILALSNKLYKDEIQKVYAKPVFEAIGFHNIIEKKNELLDEYSLTKNPFLILLILMDHLESWDRETGYISKLKDINKIEKIEIISFLFQNNTLHITINYQMHRHLITTLEKETETRLIDLLNTKVEPLLKKINLGNILKIKIIYKLNHHKQLLEIDI